ncbi:MAG TPA: AAA family ATPase [Thermoanaerobaculia bacterium]|jgi:MoxR-like ATPase|nr:AAA family ATPase [Thermoanaerobaculia bacterium]
MSHRTSAHDLKSLIQSFHPLIAIETVEEERARELLAEIATDLRLPMFEWSVTSGFNRLHGARIERTEDALAALRHIEQIHESDAIYLFKDLAPHLATPNAERSLRELAQRLTSTRSAIVLTGDPLELAHDIESLAVRFRLELPDHEELREVVRTVIDSVGQRQHVRVALSRDEAQHLVHALTGLTLNQARQVIAQAILADGTLSGDDVQTVIKCKGEIIARGGLLEFYPLDENRFELGGFASLKEWLESARVGFTAEARAMNLSAPKGVLFVGVQGCGKSLAAKYVAREWGLPLLKLDAGRLYDKYVGESEKNFHRATALAEAMAPVVLWIDEIEKALAQTTSAEADGGVSQRLFGSFLTWLQEKKDEVFVVGAANDLMRLPPELLRKGRFDEIFFVDLPAREERMNIFAIHVRLRKLDPAAFDLAGLADASDGFSGAEIEQAVISSLYRSLQRKQPPSTEAILEALRATMPLSVSRAEDIARVRSMAKQRFRPVA